MNQAERKFALSIFIQGGHGPFLGLDAPFSAAASVIRKDDSSQPASMHAINALFHTRLLYCRTKELTKMVDLTIRPFLMFEGKAEEAMNFYLSLFPNAKVLDIKRYGPNQPGPEGSIMKASFSIGNQTVLCTDSFVKHAFSFTPAFSFFVDCVSEEQVAQFATKLSEGGSTLMPLGAYGFSRKFAWVSDRFGVSWQINLP